MDDLDDDNVDMSELEANLYAQIHHDAPDAVEQYTTAQKLQQQTHGVGQPSSSVRTVTSSSVVNHVTAGGAPPKRGRYWSDVAATNAGGSFAKPSQSKSAHTKRPNPFSTSRPTTDAAAAALVVPPQSTSLIAADNRPKPFTPYTSYLSQIGSPCLADLPTTTTNTANPFATDNDTSAAIAQPTAAPAASLTSPKNHHHHHQSMTNQSTSTQSAVNPAALSRRARKSNNQKKRKNAEHTAGQLQQLDRARQAQELFQRGNAVHRMAQGKLKKTQQLRAKHERAAAARVAPPPQRTVPAAVVTIDLDSDAFDGEDGDDDDVICIPVPPPPLVCIESSDEEEQPSKTSNEGDADDDDSVPKETAAEAFIAEDFVGRRDRSRLSQCLDDVEGAHGQDALGNIADSDLDMICATVDDAIREQNRQQRDEQAPASRPITEHEPIADSPSNAMRDCTEQNIFATPKRSRAAVTGIADRSYEVSENGFAAVDIYESESSDFPESVYEKGRTDVANTNLTKDARIAAAAAKETDSDVSSIKLNTTGRSRRRSKRRKSSCSKGSDHKSCEEENNSAGNDGAAAAEDKADTDTEDDSNDGPAFVDIQRATSTPYLQRGEAVTTAKSKNCRIPAVPPPKRRRSLAGRSKTAAQHADAQSDDEFMSMLSCIVHDDKSDQPTAAGSSAAEEDSADRELEQTIDARAIVENVLSKVAASSKSASKKVKPNVAGGQNISEWMVTDEVGPARPSGAKASSAKQRSSAVENEPTQADFIVLDSVGATDPIPPTMPVDSEEGCDAVVATSLPSSSSSVANRRAPNQTTSTAAAEAVGVGEDSSDDNASVRSCSLVVDDPEICWNDEMRSFYNKSWGGESYNKSDILRAMPKNRFEWTISEADLFPSSPQQTRRFNRNIKCHNCRENGHRAAECYQPPNPQRCYMCGQTGHREPRCPSTICLRCGNKSRVFSRACSRCHALSHVPCPLCKVKGHSSRDCPDKWRRYHSTTQPNTPLTKLPVLLNKPKYCCVCASPGHLAEYCRNAIRMDLQAQPIKIQSYEESYERIAASHLQPNGAQLPDVAPYSLISVPQEHYNFQWRVNEAPDRLYGRVKTATQLQRPVFGRVSKKRKKPTRCDAEVGGSVRSKAPRTEIHSSDGSRLVLNPMSTLIDEVVDEHLQSAAVDMDDRSDEIIAAVLEESVDDNSAEQLSEEPPTQSGRLSAEDAFASTIDIDEIDEAVRQHMELDTATPSNVAQIAVEMTEQKAVKSTMPTVASTESSTVVVAQIPIEDAPPIPIELDTSTAAVSFSFISALDEIIRPKTHNILASNSFSFVSALDQINRSQPQFDIACLPETPLSNGVDDIGSDDAPGTPPPPPIISAFAEAAELKKKELETEMRRLNKEEAYLKNLKDELTTTTAQSAKKKPPKTRRTSERTTECVPADDSAVGYHVVLNENIETGAAHAGGTSAVAGVHHDSDSNYSFSDYFDKEKATHSSSAQPPTVSEQVMPTVADSVRLPDFIPIGDDTKTVSDDDDGMHTARTTPSPSSHCGDDTTSAVAASDDASNYSEAKIYLSKDHSKYLMTRNGTAFLTETYTKHGVKLRMEWCNIGNILIVQGRPTAQDSFHADLLAYCMRAECDMRKKQEISQQVPKNRLTLIRFIKEQIAQLERPLGNVRECFQRMLAGEQQRSKAGTKNADRARKTLNMMLLGQTGLREGTMHLTALQSNLRCLVETETKDVISTVFRNEVFQHFKYIFSSVTHENYADLVREYETMRKANCLPVLRLDRKLLGLKINVGDVGAAASADTMDSTAGVVSGATAAVQPDAPQKVVEETVVPQQLVAKAVAEPTQTTRSTDSEGAAPSSVETKVVSSDASLKTIEAATGQQTPSKKPFNNYAKVLAVTASAKKAAAPNPDSDPESLSDLAIVTELDTLNSGADDNRPTDASEADAQDSSGRGGRHEDACASKLWSLKCQQYVEKCRSIAKIQNNESAMWRLNKVDAKAREGKLSYTDYRMLMKIFDKCV